MRRKALRRKALRGKALRGKVLRRKASRGKALRGKALSNKDAWYKYYCGPVQRLRLKVLGRPQQIHMFECPLCDCVLKHDLSPANNSKYTMSGNLASHFCGDPHRRKLVSLFQSPQKLLPPILIVSRSCSFTPHPLIGQTQCGERWEHLCLHVSRGGAATRQ